MLTSAKDKAPLADETKKARGELKSRNEAVFDVVADALHTFSLDLIKLICGFVPRFCLSDAESVRTRPTHLHSFGSHGPAPGQFEGSIDGIAVSPDNRLWVASTKRVQVFSIDGEYLFAATNSVVATETWHEPRGIAFDTVSREVFIVGTSHCIWVCRFDGSFVRSFGSYGSAVGELSYPWGVAVDSKQGLVYVVDNSNGRVQVFKRDGTFVRIIGEKGNYQGQLGNAKGCCLTSAGVLAVANCANTRVEMFEASGKFLRNFTGTVEPLEYIYGMCLDAEENHLLFTDRNAERVHICRLDGSPVTSFRTNGGQLPIVQHPFCVCTDADNRIFVAGDNHVVRVFAFVYT